MGLTEPRYSEVLGIALEYGATAYDAVYITLSPSLKVPLLTAEQTTTSWGVKMGGLIKSVPDRA